MRSKRKDIEIKIPFTKDYICVISPFYGLGWVNWLFLLLWAECALTLWRSVSVPQWSMALGTLLVYQSCMAVDTWIYKYWEKDPDDE